ncbi:MAG: hypothetical protein Q9159_005487 [Coniocarpon cinnabarinum]
MCHTKVYRYGCGHASSRQLSSCRGTYSDPTGASVLCHASPSLTYTVSTPCSTCLYKQFRDDWEKRLSDAQEKHFVATQVMYELQDDGESCGELGDSLIGGGGVSDSFGDADAAMRERQRAGEELRQLKEEYQRQATRQFSSLVTGQGQSWKKSWRRQRKPATKNAGSSPLKNVESVEDFSAGSDDEGDWDDCASTSSLPRSPSLVSDSGSMSDSGDEGELYQSPTSVLSPSNWTLSNATRPKLASAADLKKVSFETPSIVDDDDQFLPDYGF